MIRQLAAGETVAPTAPHRYISDHGYVRLRWKVGPAEYVETYEHRFVAGLPDGEVHHVDGNKLNNDPENLLVTSKEAHARYHGRVASANSRRLTEWDGERSQYAYDKRQRRLAREAERKEFVRQIVEMRQAGLTTVEIGRRVNRDASNITRALQDAERRYGIRYERWST